MNQRMTGDYRLKQMYKPTAIRKSLTTIMSSNGYTTADISHVTGHFVENARSRLNQHYVQQPIDAKLKIAFTLFSHISNFEIRPSESQLVTIMTPMQRARLDSRHQIKIMLCCAINYRLY